MGISLVVEEWGRNLVQNYDIPIDFPILRRNESAFSEFIPIPTSTDNARLLTASDQVASLTSTEWSNDTSDCVAISQVGIYENKNSFGVTLTPSPAQNDVKVTFTGVSEALIIIYDAQGKVVMAMNQVQSGDMLSLEAFERGVYLVNIMTTSGNHT